MWRHDNGYTRDYFVRDKKIVQYFVKPLAETEVGKTSADPERTIVGKQWISKDVLEKSDYVFQSYGEGSWAIEGRLDPVRPDSGKFSRGVVVLICSQADVTALHEAASKRTEDLLRRLGSQYSKQDKAPKPSPCLAQALFSFTSVREGDLVFREGDVLEILSRTDSNDMWWLAKLEGKTGMIPANYVRLLATANSSETSKEPRKFDAPNDVDPKTNAEISKASIFKAWKGKIESWRKKPQTSEKV